MTLLQLPLLYIDPGSGSYLAQAVIAALLGIAYYFKPVKHVIVALFRKLTGKK